MFDLESRDEVDRVVNREFGHILCKSWDLPVEMRTEVARRLRNKLTDYLQED